MVLKNFGSEAAIAAQLTAAALAGKNAPKPPVNTTVNNGTNNIPTASISFNSLSNTQAQVPTIGLKA